MIEFLQWTFALEAIGVAFLPFTFWVFRWLPDRGYAFSKIAGLLGITYVTWLAGSAFPVAGSTILPVLILIGVGGIGWWGLHTETLAAVRTMKLTVGLHEVLFLSALVVWSLMRAYVLHPGIGHTEQYMDLTLLNSSLRSVSFPPYDPWMSGHAVNYYYVGYLMYATLTKLSGVSVFIGYNLALSTVFAFTVAGAYGLAFNLTRRIRWSLLGPALVALSGNWHSVLVQLPGGNTPSSFFWFWGSTRVVGRTAEGTANTINEFPFFSFLLGDLHPHVMALPVTILVMALCANAIMCPHTLRISLQPEALGRLVVIALAVGSLFAINSWDLPAYLLLTAICLGINAYLTDPSSTWWRAPAAGIPVTAIAAVVLWLPFYVHYRSPAHGFGLVSTPSNLGEFLQVFGVLLVPAFILLLTYVVVFRPAGEDLGQSAGTEEMGPPVIEAPAREVGQARIGDAYLTAGGVGLVMFVLGVRFQVWTLDLILIALFLSALMLWRILNSESPNRADAVALAVLLVGCLMLAATELIYLKDEFDGGSLYRMNTVFKFYYESWALIGIGGAYGIFRAWTLLRKHFAPAFGWTAAAVISVALAIGAYYTLEAPQSANLGGGENSLNALAVINVDHPGDAAGIQWLRSHTSGEPVLLEAVGDDFRPEYARVSTYTGLPAVMGWSGHELQWRGSDPEISARIADVNTIYRTTNVNTARSLLRKYHVSFVFVGDTERQLKGLHAASLAKFNRFMQVAFRNGATTIYRW